MRALARLVTVAAVAATAVLVPILGDSPSNSARAADTRLFDAGNIISDAVFFDALSMDAGAIQGFLNAKGASCSNGEMPCLKNYRADTADQARDSYCAGYRGAAQETAATIIAKVGVSCGISPRVLLVLLDKEQSLVSRTAPTSYAYEHATGMGCPDTASCNPAFAGFVSQVYFAARQYQKYRVDASSYRYKAGRVNTIGYAPATAGYNNLNNARCGTVDVYIANQATAGLYNYTPYVPNQAALNAQRGTGDDCSTYGNRNFWNFFTSWFGSTQSTGAGAILVAYTDLGGTSSWLGTATSGYICGLVNNGCFQNFQGGSMYWSPTSGAHPVRGAIAGMWGTQNWEKGWLGYPTSDELCGLVRGGCAQNYQGGSLYYSPVTGVAPVQSPMYAGYAASGYEKGRLGYPVARQICGLVGGGCFQRFQGGIVYYSPASGAHTVGGAIYGVWASRGFEAGALGYPTSEESCGTGAQGCVQQFQKATLAWSPSTGAQYVSGPIGAAWLAAGGPRSTLGQPIGPLICGLVRSGCFQTFQGATAYTSPASGTHAVRGAIFGVWSSRGYERGDLGYPRSDETCSASGCLQSFERWTMFWSPATGPQYVGGAIGSHWRASGGLRAAVGTPVGPEICGLVNGGCFQGFTGGSVYFSPATGAHDVSGAIRDAWAAQGWETGTLGYPLAEPEEVDGGVVQRFEGGTLTLTTATGVVARS